MKPTVYRYGGKGTQNGYTVVESPLGYVLVAATDAGWKPFDSATPGKLSKSISCVSTQRRS